jgi:hypothetical protein
MKIEIAPSQYDEVLSLHDAILYVHFLEIDGKKGWRIPTHTELSFINDTRKLTQIWYWSYGVSWNTEQEGYYAWSMNYINIGDSFMHNPAHRCTIVAVRDIE